jgi:hypothetical protein
MVGQDYSNMMDGKNATQMTLETWYARTDTLQKPARSKSTHKGKVGIHTQAKSIKLHAADLLPRNKPFQPTYAARQPMCCSTKPTKAVDATPPSCWLVVHSPSTVPLVRLSRHPASRVIMAGKMAPWAKPLAPHSCKQGNQGSAYNTAHTAILEARECDCRQLPVLSAHRNPVHERRLIATAPYMVRRSHQPPGMSPSPRTRALTTTELERPHSMVEMADVANINGSAVRFFRSMYPAAN